MLLVFHTVCLRILFSTRSVKYMWIQHETEYTECMKERRCETFSFLSFVVMCWLFHWNFSTAITDSEYVLIFEAKAFISAPFCVIHIYIKLAYTFKVKAHIYTLIYLVLWFKGLQLCSMLLRFTEGGLLFKLSGFSLFSFCFVCFFFVCAWKQKRCGFFNSLFNWILPKNDGHTR